MFASIVGIIVVGIALTFFFQVAGEARNPFIGIIAGVFGVMAMFGAFAALLFGLSYLGMVMTDWHERSTARTLEMFKTVAPWAVLGWVGIYATSKLQEWWDRQNDGS